MRDFLLATFTGPLMRADAIVVLAGEDGESRVQTAAELLRQGGADKVWIVGGRNEMPRHWDAVEMQRALFGMGIKPSRVETETDSQNTREQAVAIAARAEKEQWGRILLVASSYHLPRALLTVVQALDERGLWKKVGVTPVPAGLPFGVVPGTDRTRVQLLRDDLAKCKQYAEHVATPQRGLAYLKSWAGR